MNKNKLKQLWDYEVDVKMWKVIRKTAPDKYIGMIDDIQKESEKVRNELYEYILTVEDPYYRVLLTCRFIERKTWKEVAQIMGGSAESHRKALSRFIEENL